MRKFSFLILLVGLAVIISAPAIFAQMDHHEKGHIMVVPDGLTWNDGPASLPPGSKIAVIEGDPSKEGPFTMRIKLPANYKIPPHWHPAIEHVTVISGSLHMGLGETFDEATATKLPAGGFAVMDIGTKHFAFTKEDAVIQLHGIGPWGINYVNPDDDPRTKDKSQLETGK
jgi:hypothetical protein